MLKDDSTVRTVAYQDVSTAGVRMGMMLQRLAAVDLLLEAASAMQMVLMAGAVVVKVGVVRPLSTVTCQKVV